MVVDGVRQLRQRLFELVSWFAEDHDRLLQGQTQWRAGHDRGLAANDLWTARVSRRSHELQLQLDGTALELLPLSAGAEALLAELEAVDLAAWLAAGAAYRAPPQAFGADDHARYVIRLARERRPLTAAQAGVIYTHVRHHALVPTRVRSESGLSVAVRIKPMSIGLERCEAAVTADAVTIATTTFGDDAAIEWEGEGSAATVPTAQQRIADLAAAIDGAAQRGVDILVAPELTVPPAERSQLIERLRWNTGPSLALVVPGSFHERLASRESKLFNRAVLIDGKGNELCDHLKLVQFGRLEGAFLEAIHAGNEITVLVTPIGTVAIAICKDFCDDHAGQLWQKLQCEWLLVPAYGDGADAHERAAKQISRMVGTITVLAHEARPAGPPANSFVHHDKLERETSKAPAFSTHKVRR